MMPLTINGEQMRLAMIIYKLAGTGPFPVLIFYYDSIGGAGIRRLLAWRTIPNRLPIGSSRAAISWHCGTTRMWGIRGVYDEGFAADRSKAIAVSKNVRLPVPNTRFVISVP
ncbi:MAG: hypothetical protein J0H44_29585 [Alphaproteobacteria bacterium]|nr:hypothetical protein [Alphaproteobacteria bacterium]